MEVSNQMHLIPFVLSLTGAKSRHHIGVYHDDYHDHHSWWNILFFLHSSVAVTL